MRFLAALPPSLWTEFKRAASLVLTKTEPVRLGRTIETKVAGQTKVAEREARQSESAAKGSEPNTGRRDPDGIAAR